MQKAKSEDFCENFIKISSTQLKTLVRHRFKSVKTVFIKLLIDTVLKTSQGFAIVTVMKLRFMMM